MSAIRSPKDFWTGVIYLLLGGGAVSLAWEYGPRGADAAARFLVR